MRAAERVKRDQVILRLFTAGHTYQDIADVVGLRSPTRVHDIVVRELAGAARRHGLLVDESFALHQERLEQVLAAHWDFAPAGDHRSSEICLKVLAQQSRLYGLAREVRVPSKTAGGGRDDDDKAAPPDELARLRAYRAESSGPQW